MAPYEILGLPKTAKKEDIKRAYKKLAMVYHPDRPGGDNAKFIEIKTAYEALTIVPPIGVHCQYEHKTAPDANIKGHKFDRRGNLVIDVTFNNMISAQTIDVLKYVYHWVLFGYNGGTFTISKRDLIKCGYVFTIMFYPVIGSAVRYTIEVDDPRGKWEKFIDKLKSYL